MPDGALSALAGTTVSGWTTAPLGRLPHGGRGLKYLPRQPEGQGNPGSPLHGGRGLKPVPQPGVCLRQWSPPPTRGTWIEITGATPCPPRPGSPPARGRGLKYDLYTPNGLVVEVAPTRGRGLKFGSQISVGLVFKVVPRAGARVEIWEWCCGSSC